MLYRMAIDMKKAFKLFCTLLSALLLVTCIYPVSANAAQEIDVLDFGAIANDGKDDSAAIQAAIDHAIQNRASVLRFREGVYDFSENPVGGIGMDAYLHVVKAVGLTLEGACNSDGTPTTVFRRYNPGGDNADLRQLLYIEQAENFTMRRIQFETNPIYYTAGEIVGVANNTVSVQIADGYPTPSDIGNTKVHLPALYDKTNNTFYEQRLIWTTEDGSDAPALEIPDAENPRAVQISHEGIAEKVQAAIEDKGSENLLLFWFQGHYTDSCQAISVRYSENLLFENIRIPSSTGFALTCDFCRNVTYKNVNLSPADGTCAVAPRDALKLYGCGGDILLENVVMDGFEDDGQNCHGLYSTISEITGSNTLIMNLTTLNPYRPDWLIGTDMRFLSPKTNEITAEVTIKGAKKLSDEQWEITTETALPDDLVCSPDNNFKGATAVEFEAYLANSWTVRGCTIRNTYRGLKISAQNVLVENNLFENNVYHIYMGAENDEYWHESRNPRNVTIRNNVFKNPLSGTAIDMDFHAYRNAKNVPLMQNIYIYNNRFTDCNIGVSVKDAQDVYIYDNTFENVQTETVLDTSGTQHIYTISPEAVSDNPSADIAAAQKQKENTVLAVCIAAGVLVLAAVILLICVLIKRKKKKA